MSRGALRWLQIVGAVVALLLLGRTVVAAIRELRESSLTVEPVLLAVAVVGISATFLYTIVVWKILLADLGVRVRYRDVLQLWSFANLGRYLPGKVWQVVGVVVVARDLGLPAGLAAASSFISFGFMVGSGSLVGLLLLRGEPSGVGWIHVASAVLSLAAIAPIVWPGIVNEALRRLPRTLGCSEVPAISRFAMLRMALLHCGAWLAHGAFFFVLARSLAAPAWSELPRYAGAYSLAYIGGLIAFFAPGGIGVREGGLGLLLGTVAGGDLPAHVLAVAARLWTISAEIVVFAVAFATRRGLDRERDR